MNALVDYGAGNLLSVENAIRAQGLRVRLVRDPSGLDGCNRVILPGVGAFGDCVVNLRRQGLWEPLRSWVLEDRPFLGICVGYQILFESGEENPETPGMGVLAGTVPRFPSGTGLKVPHMGWNEVNQVDPDHPLWDGIADATHFYFVHSYRPDPRDDGIVAGRTEYGAPFAAAVTRGNLWAVQFHPERSQDAGQRVLRNFLAR